MQHKYSLGALLLATVCFPPVQKSTASDAVGLAPGIYTVGVDGGFNTITNINVNTLWTGVWKQDTNGLRAQLLFVRTGEQTSLRLGVGSTVFNSLGGYVGSPEEAFLKFELRGSNGSVLPIEKGVRIISAPPAAISIGNLPRWPEGDLKSHIGFFTNEGPCVLYDIKINDVYKIKNEDDYTLTVEFYVYKLRARSEYLDRVDLPCITAKVHLKP